MSDATLKSALRELQEDLERAVADLEVAISSLAGIDEDERDEIFVKDDDGVVSVDATELRVLLDRLADAPEDVARAFGNFDWKLARSLRAFRRATAHEMAEG